MKRKRGVSKQWVDVLVGVSGDGDEKSKGKEVE